MDCQPPLYFHYKFKKETQIKNSTNIIIMKHTLSDHFISFGKYTWLKKLYVSNQVYVWLLGYGTYIMNNTAANSSTFSIIWMQGYVGSITLLQKILWCLTRGCQLTQEVLYNGHKMVAAWYQSLRAGIKGVESLLPSGASGGWKKHEEKSGWYTLDCDTSLKKPSSLLLTVTVGQEEVHLGFILGGNQLNSPG